MLVVFFVWELDGWTLLSVLEGDVELDEWTLLGFVVEEDVELDTVIFVLILVVSVV